MQLAVGRSGVLEATGYAIVVNALGFGAVLGILGGAAALVLRIAGARVRPQALAAAYLAGGVGLSFFLIRLVLMFPPRGLGGGSGSRSEVVISLAAAIGAGLILYPMARLFGWRFLQNTRRVAFAAILLSACLIAALPIQVLIEAQSFLGLSRGTASAVDLGILDRDVTSTLQERFNEASAGVSAEGGPPNVILITVDALRADHLAACGNDWVKTPWIDLLARHSAVSCATYPSQPQTNPAVAAIMTSTYPTVNGVRVHMVDRLPDAYETLAEVLASKGYSTGAILPWAAFDPAFSGFQQGFDVYEAYVLNAPSTLENPLTTAFGAAYRRITDQGAIGGAVESVIGLRRQVEEDIDGRADVTGAAAITWLATHRSQPFFLWTHFFDPHYPWTPPPPWNELYEDGSYDGPYSGDMGFVYAMSAGAFDPDERDVAHLRSQYAGEISYADHYIGQLLGYAAEAGLLRNTIIILTADHGESLGERPGPWPDGTDWLHGDDLYTPGIQVPLMIFDPRRSLGGRSLEPPLQHIDIMPTILDLVAAPIPSAAQGRSIVPLLDGRDDGPPRAAITTLQDDRSSSIVAADGWKLIENWAEGTEELYYLPDDPGEMSNRATAAPGRAAALRAQLAEWSRLGAFRGNAGLPRIRARD